MEWGCCTLDLLEAGWALNKPSQELPWHLSLGRGTHGLLENALGTVTPLLELMAFQKGKVGVWQEESLVWGGHLLGGPRLVSSPQEGPVLAPQRLLAPTPPRGQSRRMVVACVQAGKELSVGVGGGGWLE